MKQSLYLSSVGARIAHIIVEEESVSIVAYKGTKKC